MEIYVKVDELWNYFQKHKERFKNAMDNIAEVLDSETNSPLVRIYLTEENGYPSMTIEQVHIEEDDEEVLVKECAISEKDCVEVYKKLLGRLEKFGEEIQTDDVDAADIEIVDEREAELREALAVFLNTLMGYEEGELDEPLTGDDELSEILDSIEIMLYQDFGFEIYRPQIVECDGKKQLVEFPYEESDDPYGDEE